jgi:hypothetical protein
MMHELAAFDIDRVIDGGSVTSDATRFPRYTFAIRPTPPSRPMITSKVPLTRELRVRVRK